MSEQVLSAPQLPEVYVINGVKYVLATDCPEYLEVESYATILNLVKSRARYLVAEKIGATLFITVESLEAEKARRDAKSQAVQS